MDPAVAADPEAQPERKRVHHGHADAVQAAGDLVGILVELPAGMQLRHDDLGRRDALGREHELHRRALRFLADRHVVDDHTEQLVPARNRLQHVAVAAGGQRAVLGQLAVELPAFGQVAGQRHRVDHGGAGGQRARHGHEVLRLRPGQVFPACRHEGRLGVVDDASGDQLGGEIGLVLVHQAGIVGGDVRLGIGHQPALRLQALHGHDIGDQQHVRLRLAGLDLSLQLGEDLGRAVAHPFDRDAGMLGHEGVGGLLGVGVGLARIEYQLALGRRRLGDAGGQQQGGKQDAHEKPRCLRRTDRAMVGRNPPLDAAIDTRVTLSAKSGTNISHARARAVAATGSCPISASP